VTEEEMRRKVKVIGIGGSPADLHAHDANDDGPLGDRMYSQWKGNVSEALGGATTRPR